MLRQLTWTDFLGWLAYSQLEPFDERRADFRAASVVSMLANVNRDTKKRSSPYKLDEFVIEFDAPFKPRDRTQSLEFQKSMLMAIATAYTTPGVNQ
jgi:hypothetical protein